MLELALEIQLSACDLYEPLASAVMATDARRILTDLAQQEKQLSDRVSRALGDSAKSHAP